MPVYTAEKMLDDPDSIPEGVYKRVDTEHSSRVVVINSSAATVCLFVGDSMLKPLAASEAPYILTNEKLILEFM